MLRIENLKLPPGSGDAALRAQVLKVLRLPEERLLALRILRRSIDAREGVHWVYTVEAETANEDAVLRRCRDKRVSCAEPRPAYRLPQVVPTPDCPPVIVGAGPAGLFAALVLARAGARPILLERGRRVEERTADVERFWSTGALDLTSNVQFGEGGAGAFSDGKLNTGTKDIRHRFILEELVKCGAPADILIDAKPHIGTDYLHIALKNLRQELLDARTDLRFESQLTDLDIRDGALRKITVSCPEGTYTLPCQNLILCPGHSARDTFEMLYRRGVPMEAKPFAVGVRIEQRQADCAAAQYKPPGLHVQAELSSFQRPGRIFLLRLPRRAGGGRRVRGKPGGDQRHERICPGPGKHQRRAAGEHHAGGFRRRKPLGGHCIPAAAGGRCLPRRSRRIPCPLAAGGGFSAKPPLCGAGARQTQLSPRCDMDKSPGLSAGLCGRVHRGGAADFGPQAAGL